MTLPSFTAKCSLTAEKQYFTLNKNILKTDQIVIPQFSIDDCSSNCSDSCCICLHDQEGIIESSCSCNQNCIDNCINDCMSIFYG